MIHKEMLHTLLKLTSQ